MGVLQSNCDLYFCTMKQVKTSKPVKSGDTLFTFGDGCHKISDTLHQFINTNLLIIKFLFK